MGWLRDDAEAAGEKSALPQIFVPGDIVRIISDDREPSAGSSACKSPLRMTVADMMEDEARGYFVAKVYYIDQNGALQAAVIPAPALVKA